MCRRVTCPSCGKAGWAGCGAHVDQVLAGVPKDQRCQCSESKAAGGEGSPLKGLFGGLFGR